MTEKHHGFVHNLDKSALFTILGILLLFSGAITITLVSPGYVDSTWTSPSSPYQVQMYEVSDPNLYISSVAKGKSELQFVYHLKKNYTLLAFQESETLKIHAPQDLEKYITRVDDKTLKLTSRLPLLKKLTTSPAASEKQSFEVLELYEPEGIEAFALASDSIFENWIDSNFTILDESTQEHYHQDPGVIYINNPREYRISHFTFGNEEGWYYDPSGKPVKSLKELQSHELAFRSRQELIRTGEHIYAIEGCWYCHTDQTRTLIQDVVLNGSDSYPAPPSSANEYIYQYITFPGTRRIGPDLSRTGVKRASRDWHKGHFWSPKTASKGSIMPSFQHFFDYDPRGTAKVTGGIPNFQFEAIYQYLMTKGTRITPPNQAWWLGKDPIKTKEIIEGIRKVP